MIGGETPEGEKMSMLVLFAIILFAGIGVMKVAKDLSGVSKVILMIIGVPLVLLGGFGVFVMFL